MAKSVPTLCLSKRAQDSDERTVVQQQVKTRRSDPEQQHPIPRGSHWISNLSLLEYVCVFKLFIHVSVKLVQCEVVWVVPLGLDHVLSACL